jgi:hypothetical protein
VHAISLVCDGAGFNRVGDRGFARSAARIKNGDIKFGDGTVLVARSFIRVDLQLSAVDGFMGLGGFEAEAAP